VSVRDADEAEIAVEAGADWIDVKEPDRGALGRSDVATIEGVIARVAGRRPVSAAVGELDALSPHVVEQISKIAGLRLVKIGLAGVAGSPNWMSRWRRAVARFRCAEVSVAAVAYADWERAGAPPPYEVLAHAHGHCQALLIDTFDKRGRPTPELFIPEVLADLIGVARRRGMLTVVAGRLRGDLLHQAVLADPDFVGVRGAVCRGERTASVDGQLVRAARAIMHSPRPAT
jgi:hypothetical protein